MRTKTALSIASAAAIATIPLVVYLQSDAVPAGITINEPSPRESTSHTATTPPDDTFVSLFPPPATAPSISGNLPFLDKFAGPQRDLLLRHLATSARWQLAPYRGKLAACARYSQNHRWTKTLNGYFSENIPYRDSTDFFQCRTVIGIDGPVMADPFLGFATRIKSTQQAVTLAPHRDGTQGDETYLVVDSKGATLEIFEQQRREHQPFVPVFTPQAIAHLQSEFNAVLASPEAAQRGFDPALMPPNSVTHGPPGMDLVHGREQGIYDLFARVNPGERGYVYLKVFRGGGPSSVLGHDDDGTAEYTGWSNDPGEQFFYNVPISIYGSGWAADYPARFELWFVPDSKQPERMLLAKYFHVHEWER